MKKIGSLIRNNISIIILIIFAILILAGGSVYYFLFNDDTNKLGFIILASSAGVALLFLFISIILSISSLSSISTIKKDFRHKLLDSNQIIDDKKNVQDEININLVTHDNANNNTNKTTTQSTNETNNVTPQINNSEPQTLVNQPIVQQNPYVVPNQTITYTNNSDGSTTTVSSVTTGYEQVVPPTGINPQHQQHPNVVGTMGYPNNHIMPPNYRHAPPMQFTPNQQRPMGRPVIMAPVNMGNNGRPPISHPYPPSQQMPQRHPVPK